VKPAVAFTQTAYSAKRPGGVMSQTFPVRFGRSTGIATVFEAPRNGFGWKGEGSLFVDAEGVRIAKGGRSARVSAQELAGVYREADALRFDIARASPPRRETLWVWVRSPAAAAEIVKLLPTSNTVEIEHETPGARGYRLDWRMVLSLGVAVVALTFGSLALLRPLSTSVSPDSSVADATGEEVSSTRLNATDSEADRDTGAPSAPSARADTTRTMATTSRAGAAIDHASRSQDAVTSTGKPNEETGESAAMQARAAASAEVQSAVDAAVARVSFFTFLRMADYLRAEYLKVRNSTDPATFSSLENNWWRLTVDIYTDSWGHEPHRFLALAISRSWRMLLVEHRDALYRGDVFPSQFAADELAFTDLLTARLRGATRLED
jgi:hypothetical protein